MNVRNVVGTGLIVFGAILVLLRARAKGDIKLTNGIWDPIGKLGDALYIIGTICIVLGVGLIAPDMLDLLKG